VVSVARRLLRPAAAIVVPVIVQAVWVEFLQHGSVAANAPAALTGESWVMAWLSIPGCAAVVLFFGYRLIVHDHPDPRLDLAFAYFSTGMLVLLGISVFLMIHR
jgi:hypothetical protein